MSSLKKILIIGVGALITIGIGIWIYKSDVPEAGIIFREEEVMRIGSDSVYMNEYLLYAAEAYQSYNLQYGNDVWNLSITDEKGEQSTFEAEVRKNILAQIHMTKILCMAGKEEGISLSEEEIEIVSNNAREYMEELKVIDVEEMGITVELITNFYKENTLANKMYFSMTKEVEDEEEKRELFFEKYSKYEKIYDKNYDYETSINFKQIEKVSFAGIN